MAKQLDGDQIAGSGSSPMGGRGDVRTSKFLIEVKTSGGRSLRLTEKLLDKTVARAFKEGKEPVLSLNLNGRRWVAMRFDWFARITSIQNAMDKLTENISPVRGPQRDGKKEEDKSE